MAAKGRWSIGCVSLVSPHGNLRLNSPLIPSQNLTVVESGASGKGSGGSVAFWSSNEVSEGARRGGEGTDHLW